MGRKKVKNKEINIKHGIRRIIIVAVILIAIITIIKYAPNYAKDDLADVTKLIINNNAFGYLYTKNKNGRIVTDCHGIKTKNLEITMPIYNQEELMRAEAINNMLLNNKQTEKVNVKKIAHSK